MTEHPILYSAPMVRAYLDDKKIMTRRTSGLSIINDPPQRDSGWQLVAVFQDGCARFSTPNGGDITLICPYGGYGDKLWGRESWAIGSHSIDYPNKLEVLYKTIHDDNNDRQWVEVPFDTWAKYAYKNKWRPSIHIPRWASRITQTVTSIRVERLQDITEEDAKNEGVESMGQISAVVMYAHLWNSINKNNMWSSNPWVWVIGYPKYSEEPTRKGLVSSLGDREV